MKIILILILGLIVVACTSKPSDDEIYQVVSEETRKTIVGDISRIEDFSVTDVSKGKGDTYVAHVNYDLVFTRSMEDIENIHDMNSLHNFLNDPGGELRAMALRMEYENFEAGQKTRKGERIVLFKSKNGWRRK